MRAEFSSSDMARARGVAMGSSGDQPASLVGETSAGTIALAVQAPMSRAWRLCRGIPAQ